MGSTPWWKRIDRKWLIAAAMVLVASAVIALALLRAPGDDVAQGPDRSSVGGTTQTQAGDAVTNPSGEASRTAGSGGPRPNSSALSTRTPPPPHPKGQTGTTVPTEIPAVPTQPAADGAELEQLERAPESTVWAYPEDSYDDGLIVDLVFKPYGKGPTSLGPSVVVLVESSAQVGTSSELPELKGKNMVLLLGSAQVETGGTYRARASLENRGGKLVFVIASASRTEG